MEKIINLMLSLISIVGAVSLTGVGYILFKSDFRKEVKPTRQSSNVTGQGRTYVTKTPAPIFE
jgi:hypothetical protein